MSTRTQARRRRGAVALAAIVAAPICVPSMVMAVARTWITSSGIFTVGGNWSGGVAPTANDDAIIVNADTVARIITFNPIIGAAKSLTISNTGTGTNTVSHTFGEFDCPMEQIGTLGKGAYVQSAGTNNLADNANGLGLQLGVSNGSSGTYTINADCLLTVVASGVGSLTGEIVGNGGAGTFLQSAGTNSMTGFTATKLGLILGNIAGGAGTYNLSGGTLLVSGNNTAGEIIGNGGTGNFIQSFGTNSTIDASSQNCTLIIGNSLGGFGTYTLNGNGTVSVSGGETVGNQGAGTFIQSAGAHSAVSLILGSGATGVGVFRLSGTGSFTSTSNGELIGASGIGTFTQLGGTHVANDGLILGANDGSTGTYSMSGGTLQVLGSTFNSLEVGGTGTGNFIQSGGLVTVGTDAASLNLGVGSVGGTGIYSLTNPGTLTVSNQIGVGQDGIGTFNQSAGTVTSSGVTVGSNFGSLASAGTYLVGSNAVLNVGTSGIQVNPGGTFLQNGGSVTAGQQGLTTTDSLGEGVNVQGGYYRLAGGTLEDSQIFGVTSGSFEQTGGLHLVHGVVIIGSGTATHSATYLLSSGTFVQQSTPVLNDTDLTISNLGFFLIFTGGSLVGSSGGFLNGDVNLQGGSVSGILNNEGTFNFTSGAFTAQLQNDGTFNLNGNTLSSAQTNNNELGTLNGPGATGAMNNKGIINCNGNLSTGTLTNTGLINVGTNSSLSPSSMINGGEIDLARGELLGAGSIINNGGVIAGGGTISMAVTQNAGIIHANIPNTPMTIKGALSITFPTSQLLIDPGCTMNLANGLFNTANITLLGPGATLIGNGSLLNSGTITGPGQINSVLSNGGLVRVTGGELVLAGAGDVNNSNGSFSASGGGTISVISGLSSNVGSIVLSNGAFNNGAAALNNVGMITGRGTINSGTISSNGTIALSGGTTDFFAPLTNTNRASVTGNALATFYSPVDTTVGTLTVNLGSTAVFLGPVTGVGHIAGAGVKDFEGGASLGPIATLSGTTIVGFDGNLAADSIRDSTLSVVGHAKINLNAGAGTTSRVNSLIIDGAANNWSGQLDLSNNDLLVDYSGASPIATIANQIKSGFAGGSWTGNGITSSAAAAAGVHKTALGYAEASALNLSTFGADSIDNSTVIVRYTSSGDANLDGVVNALDFNAVATNFGAASGKQWIQGDFNYDGFTNTQDFTLLGSNFNQLLPSSPLGALVPEPSLLCLASVALLGARKRR